MLSAIRVYLINMDLLFIVPKQTFDFLLNLIFLIKVFFHAKVVAITRGRWIRYIFANVSVFRTITAHITKSSNRFIKLKMCASFRVSVFLSLVIKMHPFEIFIIYDFIIAWFLFLILISRFSLIFIIHFLIINIVNFLIQLILGSNHFSFSFSYLRLSFCYSWIPKSYWHFANEFCKKPLVMSDFAKYDEICLLASF